MVRANKLYYLVLKRNSLISFVFTVILHKRLRLLFQSGLSTRKAKFQVGPSVSYRSIREHWLHLCQYILIHAGVKFLQVEAVELANTAKMLMMWDSYFISGLILFNANTNKFQGLFAQLPKKGSIICQAPSYVF